MKKQTSVITLAVILLFAMIACNASTITSSPTPAVQAPNPTIAAQVTSNVPLTAAPPLTTMKPGDYKQKITAGGVVRPYLLHIPSGYDGSSALPLVFVLHGAGGNAASMVKSTDMNQKADQQNFFVAYLNGTGDRPGWNTGITPNLGITVDDVAFIRELLADLEQQVYVDSSRVYAAGFSNGAFMSHRLGAELSDLLVGVAVVEGTIGIKQDDGTWNFIPEPRGPMPIIIINGEKDPVVIYDGGPGRGGDNFESMSVADAVSFWTKADGCTGEPQKETSVNVLTEDYQTCAAGTEVLLYSTVNGVHEWPTANGRAKFSATDAIWDFFSRHHK